MTGEPWMIVACVLAGLAVGRSIRPVVASSGAPIAARWPLPELVTASLFGLAGWQLGGSWRIVPVLVTFACLVAVSIVDLRCYRIPNRILFPSLWLTAGLIVVGELVEGSAVAIGHGVVGALVYAAILFVMHLVAPAGMGFGDVKLAVLLGLVIGWLSKGYLEAVSNVLVALLIGSFAGVVVGAGLYVLRRLGVSILVDPDEPDKMSTFPFGPPLAAGAMLVILGS